MLADTGSHMTERCVTDWLAQEQEKSFLMHWPIFNANKRQSMIGFHGKSLRETARAYPVKEAATVARKLPTPGKLSRDLEDCIDIVLDARWLELCG